MMGWLIGFGAVFISAATALFIAGIINDRTYLLRVALVAAIVGVSFAIISARILIYRTKFKHRTACYIVKGQNLQYEALTVYTIKGYSEAMQRWTDKVAGDIGKNKGKAEMNLFLNDIGMKASLEQLQIKPEAGLVNAVIGQRITYLENLYKRL